MNGHPEIQALLDEYVDDELAMDEREAVALHLSECVECSGEVAFIRALREQAGALPRAIEPERDLWAGIEARLKPRDARQPVRVIAMERHRRAPHRWRGWAAAAVAASLLVAASVGITIRLMENGSVTDAPVAAVPENALTPQRPLTSFAAFEPVEHELQATLATLTEELEARRSTLSPEMLRVVDENLAIIDAAVAEIRAALAADSASVELPLLLSGVYRTKVELLQSTLRLTATT